MQFSFVKFHSKSVPLELESNFCSMHRYYGKIIIFVILEFSTAYCLIRRCLYFMASQKIEGLLVLVHVLLCLLTVYSISNIESTLFLLKLLLLCCLKFISHAHDYVLHKCILLIIKLKKY